MIRHLLSPLLAVVSPDFYRQMGKSSLEKGLLYLLYLSLIAGLLLGLNLNFSFFPKHAEPAIRQLIEKMPVLTLSDKGLSMDRSSPYTIRTGSSGLSVVFDMNQEALSGADISAIKSQEIRVTQKKIYVYQGRNRELRIYDVQELRRQRNLRGELIIDHPAIQHFYKQLMGYVSWGIPILAVIILFAWKLFAALLFSLPALLINCFRRERLDYSGILNVTLLAMTPAMILGLCSLTARIFLPVWSGWLLTLAYLVFGIKLAERPASVQS